MWAWLFTFTAIDFVMFLWNDLYSVMELNHKTFLLVLYAHEMKKKKSVGGTKLKYIVIMLIVSFLKTSP